MRKFVIFVLIILLAGHNLFSTSYLSPPHTSEMPSGTIIEKLQEQLKSPSQVIKAAAITAFVNSSVADKKKKQLLLSNILDESEIIYRISANLLIDTFEDPQIFRELNSMSKEVSDTCAASIFLMMSRMKCADAEIDMDTIERIHKLYHRINNQESKIYLLNALKNIFESKPVAITKVLESKDFRMFFKKIYLKKKINMLFLTVRAAIAENSRDALGEEVHLGYSILLALYTMGFDTIYNNLYEWFMQYADDLNKTDNKELFKVWLNVGLILAQKHRKKFITDMIHYLFTTKEYAAFPDEILQRLYKADAMLLLELVDKEYENDETKFSSYIIRACALCDAVRRNNPDIFDKAFKKYPFKNKVLEKTICDILYNEKESKAALKKFFSNNQDMPNFVHNIIISYRLSPNLIVENFYSWLSSEYFDQKFIPHAMLKKVCEIITNVELQGEYGNHIKIFLKNWIAIYAKTFQKHEVIYALSKALHVIERNSFTQINELNVLNDWNMLLQEHINGKKLLETDELTPMIYEANETTINLFYRALHSENTDIKKRTIDAFADLDLEKTINSLSKYLLSSNDAIRQETIHLLEYANNSWLIYDSLCQMQGVLINDTNIDKFTDIIQIFSFLLNFYTLKDVRNFLIETKDHPVIRACIARYNRSQLSNETLDNVFGADFVQSLKKQTFINTSQ